MTKAASIDARPKYTLTIAGSNGTPSVGWGFGGSQT